MLRVGVIGCGAIAQRRHLPEYANRHDVEIIGVSDPNLDRVRQVAAQFGAKYAFASYQELLGCKEIDAVSVCVPNHLHASVSIEALQAGKHVLCEKPMAANLSEAKEMLEVADKNRVRLMIGHNQRFMSVHKKAKEILDSGHLGKVFGFQATFGHSGPEYWSVDGSQSWFFKQDEAVAGVLGDLGVHKADLLRWLLNDDFAEVSTIHGTLHKNTNVEDHAVMIIRTRNGAIGTITASWLYYANEINATVIHCENGTMKIGVDQTYGLIVENKDGTRELYDLGIMQSNKEGGQFSSGVIDHFVEGILNGTGHAITGEDGFKVLELVLAGMQSAKSKQTVSLL